MSDKVVEPKVDTKAVADAAKKVEPKQMVTLHLVKQDLKFRYGNDWYHFKKGEKNVQVPAEVLEAIGAAGYL